MKECWQSVISNCQHGRRSWGLRGSLHPEICRRDQSMFWPHSMSHSFIQNRCWITIQVSHHEGWKTCVKKRKVKLIFRGAGNSLMTSPDWHRPLILRHIYAIDCPRLEWNVFFLAHGIILQYVRLRRTHHRPVVHALSRLHLETSVCITFQRVWAVVAGIRVPICETDSQKM